MKLLKTCLFRILIAASIAVTPTVLSAQASGGVFTGEVRDSSGAVVPDATIKIRSVETGVEAPVLSTSVGVYTSPSLNSGQYTLSAQKTGFKVEEFGPVTLQVNQVTRVDFVLSVGDTTETVKVEASGVQLLSTDSSVVSQVIVSTEVAEIPLNGRSWQQLIYLSAGITPGAPGESGAPNPVNINGQRDKANLYMVDGVSTTSSAQGRANNNNVPLDAIREFSIQSGAFSAEYGNVGGGVINLQIKSGTNRFHGSLFEFLRNDKFDAANFFSNLTGQHKNPLRYNQFGGSIGGPIRRNKTFFFMDYQGIRNRNSTPLLTTLPDPKQYSGDFSGLVNAAKVLVPIFDPSTLPRLQYPGNLIPASKLDPAALALANLLPHPNQFSASGVQLAVNNYAVTRAISSTNDAFDVRVDHQFSTRNSIFARHSFQNTSGVTPSIFGPPLGGPPSLAGNSHSRVQTTGIGHTYQFRPNLINELRIGLNRETTALLQEDYGQDLSSKYGIPGINVSPETSGLANITVSGLFGIGGTILAPLRLAVTNWNFSEKLLWVVGRHTFKAGFDYAYENGATGYLVFGRGFYVFEPLMTSNGGVGGNAFASFLAGPPTAVNRDIFPPGLISLRTPRYGMYFQDDFKASSRLTMNLGVRYDIMPNPSEEYNRLSNFNPATRTMLVAGSGADKRLRQTDFRNIAPRVGLAYAVGSDRKTVIRSGYGIGYVDPLGGTSVLNSNEFNIPYYFLDAISQFPLSPPQYVLSSKLPTLVMPSPNAPTGNQRYWVPGDRNQYSQTWTLSVQRALNSTTMIESAYVGTSGSRLMMSYNINAAQPGTTAPAPRRPFGAALGEIRAISDTGHSTYHGIQTKIEHRFSHGLYFLASHTWSKAIDNQSNGTDGSASSGQYPQDPTNFRADRGLAAFDRAQRFVASAVWEIPVGKGRKFAGSLPAAGQAVLGGWQMSGVLAILSGPPFSALMNCADVNAEGNNCRPNRIASGDLPSDQRSIYKWFSTAAFVKPVGVYGGAGRNILRAPGSSNLDLGLSKSFRFAERRRIQFRAESFNLFNHPNFGVPNTSIDSPGFGTITGVAAGRVIQFGLRLDF